MGDDPDVQLHVDEPATASVWRRLLVTWPRFLYRWNERRDAESPYPLVQVVGLASALALVTTLGAVGALVAVLVGASAEGGLWTGGAVGCTALLLAGAYLSWGGLVEWSSTRRQPRGPAAGPVCQ